MWWRLKVVVAFTDVENIVLVVDVLDVIRAFSTSVQRGGAADACRSRGVLERGGTTDLAVACHLVIRWRLIAVQPASVNQRIAQDSENLLCVCERERPRSGV